MDCCPPPLSPPPHTHTLYPPTFPLQVTMHVVTLGKWMAADMYLKEIDSLRFEVRVAGGGGGEVR